MNASGSLGLLPPFLNLVGMASRTPVLAGGGARWRVTQAGPQGGVRQFLLWQVQAEGSGDCWFLLQ